MQNFGIENHRMVNAHKPKVSNPFPLPPKNHHRYTK